MVRKLCADKEMPPLVGSGIAPPKAGYSVWREKGLGRAAVGRSFLMRAPIERIHNAGLDDPRRQIPVSQRADRLTGNCAERPTEGLPTATGLLLTHDSLRKDN